MLGRCPPARVLPRYRRSALSRLARQVFVISDTHLGGVYPDSGEPGARGFRICTHADDLAAFIRELAGRPAGDPATELVINGDLVDFLAEREEDDPPWRAFTPDPEAAAAKLRAIVRRDQVVFDALKAFLEAGHRLVVLLGNHDVELALPGVRDVLREAVGGRSRDFEFIHDGEAYLVGDALIEHGNDYDPWNRVSQAQLRRIRALLSRGRHDDVDFFEPPAGSHMVADVINPVKERYKFVDLLKPETSATFPLLLALEPSYKPLLAKAAANKARIADVEVRRRAARAIGADISAERGAGPAAIGADISSEAGAGPADIGGDMGTVAPASHPETGAGGPGGVEAELDEELSAVLGEAEEVFHEALAHGMVQEDIGSDISSGGVMSRVGGLLSLLVGSGDSEEAVQRRLPALLHAIRAVQDDTSFDRSQEGKGEYWHAACELSRGDIKHVIFGHTHLPKRVPLESGGFYLNSGTWADVLRFPAEIVAGSDEEALPRLREFVEAMRASDFSDYTLFHPTYVRLDLDASDTVVEAELCDYEAD